MGVRVLVGDCREVLATLPDESVHCCVTSPPYFGLRDYGTAKWEGGDAACDHVQPVSYKSSTLGASTGGRSEETHARSIGAQATPYRHVCAKCGARRIDSQIGLEPTPDEFVAALVAVFREVRRVLRADGTVWLNMGDSYARAGGEQVAQTKWLVEGASDGQRSTRHLIQGSSDGAVGRADRPGTRAASDSLKAKDLIGIPWRVAFALQADGWYLRQDIIWAKPNPMPESVRDRCTKAHEYLFLLAKSERYYYDANAIREPNTEGTIARLASGPVQPKSVQPKNAACRQDGGTEPYAEANGRNKRSVWTVSTKPFSGAHFATFPPDLIEPCVLAGCPVGGTVLDPFGGAGTTGLVADRHGRNAVLIELNPEYAAMARARISGDSPLFAEVA